MRIALYEPGLGYYMAGTQKFGRGGDYVTAPELSPLFGYAVAEQCAEFLSSPGATVFEFGGGSGALAASIMRGLAAIGCPLERYTILELSPELRARQSALLHEQAPEWAPRVEWATALPATPLDGIVIANEVCDALPVKTFRFDGTNLSERVVVDRDGKFTWHDQAPDPRFSQWFEQHRDNNCFQTGDVYDFEICAAVDIWISDLSSILNRGAALLFDYGHARSDLYSYERRTGTLQCHYRHRVHNDPFINIGLQDITASVDFTRIAETATTTGLRVAGYTDQMNFLIDCNVLEKLETATRSASESERLALTERVKTLLLPNRMGHQFKAMCLDHIVG